MGGLKIKKLIVILLALFLFVNAGVGLAEENAKETLVIGEADWAGIWAKNALIEHILENIGYEIKRQQINDTIIHKTMAKGDIDFYVGSWMPSAEGYREPLQEDLHLVRKNLEQGLYTLGVPKYAWEKGVKSFADLDKFADKFEHKIYTGPPGWPFSKKIEKAIKNDTYGLGDWEIVNSSTTAMVTNMKQAWQKEEWIVSLAWTPHWMNYVMDIKYLEDPKGVWVGSESWVDTLTRLEFKEDYPEVYKFLENFEVNNEMSNTWIYKIGQESEEPEKVTQEWISDNMDIVKGWLKGVKATNGKPAFEVFKNNFNTKE